jgi:hypothetical protein
MPNRLRPFGVVVFFLLAGPVQAGIPTIPPPLAQRVAVSDLVVLGNLTAMDAEPVQASPFFKFAAAPKMTFRVGTLRVESVVSGNGKAGELRVGYAMPPPPAKAPASWKGDEEGCFFLRKHPEGAFHVILTPWDFLDATKKKEAYEKDVAVVRHCARLLADPGPGLRSKDADERLLAAAVVIFHCRTPRYVYKGAPRTESLDAEQSRLVLKILNDGELEPAELDEPFTRLTLFFSMNLGRKDGWVPPRALREVPGAARKWLEENADTYRIPKYLPDAP